MQEPKDLNLDLQKIKWDEGSDTRSVYFDQMEISSDNMLGAPDKGFKQFLRL